MFTSMSPLFDPLSTLAIDQTFHSSRAFFSFLRMFFSWYYCGGLIKVLAYSLVEICLDCCTDTIGSVHEFALLIKKTTFLKWRIALSSFDKEDSHDHGFTVLIRSHEPMQRTLISAKTYTLSFPSSALSSIISNF